MALNGIYTVYSSLRTNSKASKPSKGDIQAVRSLRHRFRYLRRQQQEYLLALKAGDSKPACPKCPAELRPTPTTSFRNTSNSTTVLHNCQDIGGIVVYTSPRLEGIHSGTRNEAKRALRTRALANETRSHTKGIGYSALAGRSSDGPLRR